MKNITNFAYGDNHHFLTMSLSYKNWIKKCQYIGYKLTRNFPLHHFYLRQDYAKRYHHYVPMYLKRSADPYHGERILSGHFYDHGTIAIKFYDFISRPKPDIHLLQAGVSISTIRELQSFDWLTDIYAYAHQTISSKDLNDLFISESPYDKACRFCSDFLQAWISQCNHYSSISWHIPTLARRLNNWFYFFSVKLFNQCSNYDDLAIMRSITKQLHHLRLCVINETHGSERLLALICWVNASLCFETEASYLEEGVLLLCIELQKQLTNPQSSLLTSPLQINNLLAQIHYLNNSFVTLDIRIPYPLIVAETYLAVFAKHYQFDYQKRLACFHGSHAHVLLSNASEIRCDQKKMINTYTKLKQFCDLLPIKRVDHQGFTLFLDTTDVNNNNRKKLHASALAFELSDRKHMLFVNALPQHPKKARYLQDSTTHRTIYAHSSTYVEGIEWLSIHKENIVPSYTVKSRVIRQQNQVWLEGSYKILNKKRRMHQDGQLKRIIYFLPEHQNTRGIRGKDTLELSRKFRGEQLITLVSQFHVHPDIDITPLKDGKILLRDRKEQQTWQLSSFNHVDIAIIAQQYSAENEVLDIRNNTDKIMPLQTLRLSRTIDYPKKGKIYCIYWELIAQEQK